MRIGANKNLEGFAKSFDWKYLEGVFGGFKGLEFIINGSHLMILNLVFESRLILFYF